MLRAAEAVYYRRALVRDHQTQPDPALQLTRDPAGLDNSGLERLGLRAARSAIARQRRSGLATPALLRICAMRAASCVRKFSSLLRTGRALQALRARRHIMLRDLQANLV